MNKKTGKSKIVKTYNQYMRKTQNLEKRNKSKLDTQILKSIFCLQ